MSNDDRDILFRRLSEDLIGPYEEEEKLSSRPSDIYLTGILWPYRTKIGGENNEKLGSSSQASEESADSGEAEEVALSNINRPSTAGISFAVVSSDPFPHVSVKISFATYGLKGSEWQRHPHTIGIPDVVIGEEPGSRIDLAEYGAPYGVKMYQRAAPWNEKWLVTFTLVNEINLPVTAKREEIETSTLFQVGFVVIPNPGTSLIARPSRRSTLQGNVEDEELSAALLYRNASEYATGHTCSATWEPGTHADTAASVSTTWIPSAIVPAFSPLGHEIFNELRKKTGSKVLSAEWLSGADDKDLSKALLGIPDIYGKWIDLQEKKIASLPEPLREQAGKNLSYCRVVRDRMMESAVRIGKDPVTAEAFRLANRAMLLQHSWDPEKSAHGPLEWRPFQIGFILLAISSLADKTHHDRNTMDLLWFPTGGGKTEAYLTLIAFLTFHRRLDSPKNPDSGAGVAAVMRYTLRLLTTQQFVRAASMMMACEAMRRGRIIGVTNISRFGTVPFSIGLWVGGEATPNNFKDARESLNGMTEVPSPKQLATCPACGKSLVWFADPRAEAVRVRCDHHDCVLYSDTSPLPVHTVDTDVYRECPTLLIGTIDKFSQIVRKKDTNRLFGLAGGHPPDLIIQDELHLISGPLGTLAGLYEVAVDRMFTHGGIRPKIIGSTATIRRAQDQIHALFDRETCQFPPPAVDADDSGFAVVDKKAPGRKYIGLTTTGRSAKFTIQAASASLLQSADAGIGNDKDRDPYWTLVSYFNSLRELGGALVLMQDDVNDSIATIADLRSESRRNPQQIQELTSRRTQIEVREMLDLLGYKAGDPRSLDIVLATNMISVGVDIPRLGLMLINGQPKGISEYIQATSRVGRGNVPGLIVAVLNNAKARDRSHYESFETWHSTLYRDVEATSVTPFASRARDRALHAVLVALIRHLVPGMMDKPDFRCLTRPEIKTIVDYIVQRAADIDPDETSVRMEVNRLLASWDRREPKNYWSYYSSRDSLLQDAEKAAILRALGREPGEAWSTMNNMRSVEPSTRFRMREHLRDFSAGGGQNGQ